MRISISLPRLADLTNAAQYLESKSGKARNICMGVIWDAERILREQLINSIYAAGYENMAGAVEFWHFGGGAAEVSQITYPVGYNERGTAYALILNVVESKGRGIVSRAVASARGACLAQMQSTMDGMVDAWNRHCNLS